MLGIYAFFPPALLTRLAIKMGESAIKMGESAKKQCSVFCSCLVETSVEMILNSGSLPSTVFHISPNMPSKHLMLKAKYYYYHE